MMGSPSETHVSRRRVSYQSLDDIREDLERLATQPIQTVGQWSFAQILRHLTRTVHASFDGFGFKAPWIVRKMIAPLIKRKFLTKPMPAGFKLPKTATVLIPSEGIETITAVDEFRAALGRLEREIPRAEHPVFGLLKPEQWQQLHLRHAELHLSFVVPE